MRRCKASQWNRITYKKKLRRTKGINENLSVTYMCAKELMVDSLDIGVEFVYLIDVPSTSTWDPSSVVLKCVISLD